MSRTRRLSVLVFLGCGLAGVIAYVAFATGTESAIGRENAAKLCEGQTLAEVEAILGGPERDESSGPVTRDKPGCSDWWDREQTLIVPAGREWSDGVAVHAARPPKQWTSDRVMVFVRLDAAGRVAWCKWYPVRRMREHPLDVIRRWFAW